MLSNDNCQKSKDKKVMSRMQKKWSFYFLLAPCMLQAKGTCCVYFILKRKKKESYGYI